MQSLRKSGTYLVVAVSAVLVALVAVAGAEAVESDQEAGRVDLRVWQSVRDPQRVFLSARPSGGTWGATEELALEETNERKTFRYSDRTVTASVAPGAVGVKLRVWQSVDDPRRVYLSARPFGGPWGATEQLPLEETNERKTFRYNDRAVAVPWSELVDDAIALLAWRDTLGGTATLDWSGGRAISSWTGVTVAGTPRRVTKLELANSGLTGELSGLLGELTGLTQLRLDGNALTGRIPSKAALLTGLTHVYLGGNALTGCLPPALRAVPNGDLATLGFKDCGAPVVAGPSYREPTLTAGTYQFIWPGYSGQFDSPLIFDVPEGLEVREGLESSDSLEGPPVRALVLEDSTTTRDAVTGRPLAWIAIDVRQGAVYGPWVHPDARPGLATLFDRLAESVWLDQDCLVATVNQCGENRE
ncbi:MAG: hypothetical protein OXH41_13755 [Chloroflexi bacterium]|nr:hypothetical protein [Chloroflexota bacterium]